MPRADKREPSRKPSATQVKAWLAVAGLAVVLGAAALLRKNGPLPGSPPGQSGPSGKASIMEDDTTVYSAYAGSKSCQACHEEAYDLWAGSNHGLAERVPDPDMDRQAFEPARTFKHGSQRASVGRDGKNFVVTCVGLSRTNEEHRVVRVIGHDPLRQFLVEFPGGRLQTLQASYDPKTNEWFDVYDEEDRQPGEWGHWTGRGMNWNNMCAGCHNTRVRKNYDQATDSYQTRMAERTVGCESCHGSLKAHNDWQAKYGKSGMKDPTVPKFERQQVLENCGFCHARRADLTGDFKPGDSFFDHQSLTVPDRTDRFYPDGQVRDEDYEFAAFLGSRMQTNGVYCLDCHNPHTMKTVLPGNWLCMRCHNGSITNAPVIEPVSHSHHQVYGYNPAGELVNSDLMAYKPKEIKETGGECVNCHMPQTVYMQRHWRHDHGFTIPDPLLTKQHSIPNACNRCHSDKSVDWALEACDKWYGQKMERPTRQRAQWIARARSGDGAARDPLLALVEGNDNPYWRGVAAGLLAQWIGEPRVKDALLKCLVDPHPLVREQAIGALEPLIGQAGAGIGLRLRPLLEDPVRSVRVRAAGALRNELPAGVQTRLELEHSLEINADQPTGQMQLGADALGRGAPQAAVAHYQKAVDWDGGSAPIRHELAIALSTVGRTRDAIEQLEAACRLEPKEAEYQFKLGLAWNELGAVDQTVAALENAVRLDPRHARAWFNLGLARNMSGRHEAALEALSQAESLAPEDPQIPFARATILAAQGQLREAKLAAQRALAIRPGYQEAFKLVEELSRNPASQ